jgi:hypothetical protein
VQATTIRRLIVFGVCALGVGSLYLVPGLTPIPYQVGSEPINDAPTAQPSDLPEAGGPQAAATSTTRTVATGGLIGPDGKPTTDRQQGSDEPPGGTNTRRPSRGNTAYDPRDAHDEEPPSPVTAIDPASVTKSQLKLQWAPSGDNVGVTGYRVLVNGFVVTTTTQTHASVPWFNVDAGQHAIQVRALDAAGNESESSATLLVTRPSTEPTPTPDPSQTPTPDPSASATATGDPSGNPSGSADSAPADSATPASGAGR